MSDRQHRCSRATDPHDPGTHSCYSNCGCRCWTCCRARSVYEQNRKKANGTGQNLMVDAEPVRQHLLELAGSPGDVHKAVGSRTIAAVAGVSRSGVRQIMFGKKGRPPSVKVKRATAQKLLAVTIADMADGATVPAGPTIRRINEMLDAGWTKTAIAIRIHGPGSSTLQVGSTRVTVGTARKVAQLHQEWCAGQIPTQGRRRRGEVADAVA